MFSTFHGVDAQRTKEFDSFLVSIFAARPMWHRKQVEDLEGFRAGTYLVGKQLPKHAYSFATGPWKGMWARCLTSLDSSF